MKSIMQSAFAGNTNPVITLDSYGIFRGFLLSLMLLCIMDEYFFVSNLGDLIALGACPHPNVAHRIRSYRFLAFGSEK